MKPSKAVDTHAHEFTPAMRAAGISHAVLVQPRELGTDNARLLAAIGRDPEHLRGVAVVDPSIDADALERLRAGGVRAIRIDATGCADGSRWSGAGWQGLLGRVREIGWHVEVHADAGRLAGLLPALGPSGIAVALEHFGNPGTRRGSLTATLAAAAELASTRPVWVKLSAPHRLGGADPAVLATHWDRVLGPGFLVWGSDWPSEGAGREYPRPRRVLGAWVGVARAGRILWDNAARLYGF